MFSGADYRVYLLGNPVGVVSKTLALSYVTSTLCISLQSLLYSIIHNWAYKLSDGILHVVNIIFLVVKMTFCGSGTTTK